MEHVRHLTILIIVKMHLSKIFIFIADKSKDFFDDAIMEHVRHHLLQLSSIESVVTTGPPSAITFHSSVSAILIFWFEIVQF